MRISFSSVRSDRHHMASRMNDIRLASVLRRLLNEFDIYDVETFATCVQEDPCGLAEWLRSTVDAAGATEPVLLDKGCTASFSPAGTRLVSKEVQSSVQSVDRSMQTAVDIKHVGTGMQRIRYADCSTNTTSFAALKDAALEVAGRDTRALMEPILTRAAEAAEAAIKHVSARLASVEELRAATRATAERCAAEAAAAAADRAAVTRREQQLQTFLNCERVQHKRFRSRADQLQVEVQVFQGLLQEARAKLYLLEEARLQSES